ncbi:DUF6207 family protein [Streptomyces sp. NPDC060053]
MEVAAADDETAFAVQELLTVRRAVASPPRDGPRSSKSARRSRGPVRNP